MRYLDPKNDLTFKKVFGQHPNLLKSFLNAMLPLQEDEQIVELEYLPAEMVPEIPLNKNTIVDVRCNDKNGRQFIVEMQMHWTTTFRQRVLFNASKAYVRQLDKNEEYKLLQPVFALSIVNDIFEKDIPEFYHHYKFVHNQYNQKQIKGLEMIFVELPKFMAKNISQKKLQVLWLRYLTEIDDKTVEIDKILLDNPEIRQAIETVEESAFTKAELEAYDRYWDIIRTEKTLMSGAKEDGLTEGEKIGLEKGEKIGIEKGEKIGIEKGEKIGIEKGEKIGIEKGEKIGIEKGEKITLYKTALLSIKNDLPIETIMLITGLPKQIINKLAELLKKYGEDAENHFDELTGL